MDIRTRFISLGRVCITRWYLAASKLPTESGPFDETMTCSDLVVRFLDQRLAGIVPEEEDLTRSALPGNNVISKKTKQYFHGFLKNDKFTCWQNGKIVDYPVFRQKLEYLKAKFLRLADEAPHLSYVYALPEFQTPENDATPIYRALERLRKGLPFDLYCVVRYGETPKNLSVPIRFFEALEDGKMDWQGNQPAWKKIITDIEKEYDSSSEKATHSRPT